MGCGIQRTLGGKPGPRWGFLIITTRVVQAVGCGTQKCRVCYTSSYTVGKLYAGVVVNKRNRGRLLLRNLIVIRN